VPRRADSTSHSSDQLEIRATSSNYRATRPRAGRPPDRATVPPIARQGTRAALPGCDGSIARQPRCCRPGVGSRLVCQSKAFISGGHASGICLGPYPNTRYLTRANNSSSPLGATCYLLPATCYLLPATRYLLPATPYPLLATRYLLPASVFRVAPQADYAHGDCVAE